MKFEISHELGVSAEALWKNNFNPDLEAVIQKEIRLQEYKVDSKKQGATTIRSVRVVPTVDMPTVLKKAIGADTIGYVEEQRIPAKGMHYEWKTTADKLTDKIDIHGTFRVEPLGPDRCKRTFEGEARVRIFGVGGLAEKFLVSELERQYGQVAGIQERWIKANG
jgi:hypothetical protein